MSDKKSTFGFNIVSIDPGSSEVGPHDGCKGCSYGTKCSDTIGCNRCSAPCSSGCKQSASDGKEKAFNTSKSSLFQWGNDAEKPSFYTSDSDSSTDGSTDTMKPL